MLDIGNVLLVLSSEIPLLFILVVISKESCNVADREGLPTLLDPSCQADSSGEGHLAMFLCNTEGFLVMHRDGFETSKIEVRYENLTVKGDAYVGDRALPSLYNATFNSIQNTLQFLRLTRSKKRNVNILQCISGIIKPSRMTLLLGPPGAGKTTLLLALAGKLDHDLNVSGNVTY
ncbi:plant PDR ABC transporter associated [Artemisia annua]|uniref:Plant PDR ABC transporter associated n=1 Tax=Artemisia annua TaxID=35608 RepID=A0A2U1LJ92_ARTAN|nr:plant PDR ABC transporter associated [Artemisia annua]